MKIGIVSSANESLLLFQFLCRYDHEYVIYYDSAHAPYGKKYFETSLSAVQKGIDFLLAQGVEKIILPPVYELYYLEDNVAPFATKILPLFSEYLLQQVFPYSLVGKIGLFWDNADIEVAQKYISWLASSYTPTPQQATKKFHFPFVYREKTTVLFQPLLDHLSKKSTLLNTVIKHDLRYFKDAFVDTLIPLNYCYLAADTTIRRFFNTKKTRFHGKLSFEQIFSGFSLEPSVYQVKLFATDSLFSLENSKRLLWLLERGKTVPLEKQQVTV